MRFSGVFRNVAVSRFSLHFVSCFHACFIQGVLVIFLFTPWLESRPGVSRRVMDRARIAQQSTETLFAWLLLLLTELCRRFHVNLGNVVIECFEVNYPVPPAASCPFRCDHCDLPCSCTRPDHLQHSCGTHRRNH